MVEIKFILFGRTIPLPCCTHVSAVVTDLKTSRDFLVNYPFHRTLTYPLRENNEVKSTLYDSAVKNTCCIKVVKLYSEKPFDTLKKALDKEYNAHWVFSFRTNNCSNKVYHVLNEAFNLEEEYIKSIHSCYSWICCFFCMASCGILSSCCPAPPCLKTPGDVFSLANWLSLKYGTLTPAMRTELASRESKEKKEPHTEQIKVTQTPSSLDPVEKTYQVLNKFGIK